MPTGKLEAQPIRLLQLPFPYEPPVILKFPSSVPGRVLLL